MARRFNHKTGEWEDDQFAPKTIPTPTAPPQNTEGGEGVWGKLFLTIGVIAIAVVLITVTLPFAVAPVVVAMSTAKALQEIWK